MIPKPALLPIPGELLPYLAAEDLGTQVDDEFREAGRK